MSRCIGYARCSTDKQDDSVAQQETAIREWCAANGHKIGEFDVYTDEGKSGTEWKNRHGLRAMLEACETRRDFDLVVMYDMSRLGRPADPKENMHWLWVIEQHGKTVHFVNGANGGGFASDLMRMLQSYTASEFSKTQATNVRRGMNAAAKQGKYTTGIPPYGYVRNRDTGKLEIGNDPQQIEAVRFIYREFSKLKGKTEDATRVIADRLNEAGLPSPTSKRSTTTWDRWKVYRILKNTTYRGYRDQDDGQGGTIRIDTPCMVPVDS